MYSHLISEFGTPKVGPLGDAAKGNHDWHPYISLIRYAFDLTHASADGQKLESRLKPFKTRYSSKYFGANKGVSSATLVANHTALNAKIISSNEHESHYIFDLLQSNTSEIKPDELSTDTHGVNQINFALLDLFAYNFALDTQNSGRSLKASPMCGKIKKTELNFDSSIPLLAGQSLF